MLKAIINDLIYVHIQQHSLAEQRAETCLDSKKAMHKYYFCINHHSKKNASATVSSASSQSRLKVALTFNVLLLTSLFV